MNGPFGIIRGEDISAYHQNEAVSSTRLMDLRPSAYHYYLRHVAKTLAAKICKEFDVGTGGHCLILEGRAALEARTVLQPATYPTKGTISGKGVVTADPSSMKPWTYAANYCKDWRAAHAGKVILTADDFATIDKMAAAVGENPDATALLSGGESEVTFRVQHPAFAVQCRADMWHKGGGTPYSGGHQWTNICVDLKTCDSIEQFRAHYFAHRYYYRAAFYCDVIEQVVGERPAFVFVAVEKSAPWRCEVFEPAEGDLELGRNEMLADLKLLRECFEKNEWPNSRLGVQPIKLKGWQREMSEENGAGIFAEIIT